MARIRGTGGEDYITVHAPFDIYPVQATDGLDVIRTFGGNDYVSAGGARDHVELGSGDDSAFGDSGNDWISGGAGSDRIFGDAGGATWDQIGNLVQPGNDKLYGGAGNDYLNGEAGDDFLRGGSGDDGVVDHSGAGNVLHGDAGNDWVEGVGHLYGDRGNDALIAVDNGVDGATLSGGAGADYFGIDLPASGDPAAAHRTFAIVDFNPAQGDHLNISGSVTFPDGTRAWVSGPDLFRAADSNGDKVLGKGDVYVTEHDQGHSILHFWNIDLTMNPAAATAAAWGLEGM